MPVKQKEDFDKFNEELTRNDSPKTKKDFKDFEEKLTAAKTTLQERGEDELAAAIDKYIRRHGSKFVGVGAGDSEYKFHATVEEVVARIRSQGRPMGKVFGRMPGKILHRALPSKFSMRPRHIRFGHMGADTEEDEAEAAKKPYPARNAPPIGLTAAAKKLWRQHVWPKYHEDIGNNWAAAVQILRNSAKKRGIKVYAAVEPVEAKALSKFGLKQQQDKEFKANLRKYVESCKVNGIKPSLNHLHTTNKTLYNDLCNYRTVPRGLRKPKNKWNLGR